ncbi:hypothetical protein AAHE18_02G196000 [Arachis hypogaea]|uniref:DUF4378 domain-containing protein n=1 Tax=Arachis hypogaea TaxID=3818 RepID=A0A445E7A7_ARAHY|nr:uncharacterized protein DS421_12g385820 [Arachis hypogaea]RYR71321.1 hypothetical protein Ahy_A02g005592 [Arachis hypogaea]
MAQKKNKHFLHELLSEDQEPFLLNNYISDKQNQLTIHFSKQKTGTLKTSTLFPIHHLCKNALCFNYSSTAPPTTTPDITKSPLFRFSQRSSTKSPCSARASSPNAMFLHVPARTASILLEAALRIQKHSNSRNANGFGFFGSFFRRFTHRGRRNKRQIQSNDNNAKRKKKVKDILKFELDLGRRTTTKEEEENKKKENVMVDTSGVGFRCSCSEEGVCSSSSVHDDDDDNDLFCESPFRFVLQRSPSATSSSGRRTPEFSSPASSPNRHRTEDKEHNNNNGDDSINKFQSGKQEEEEEEEEKEQCSPVSVLDPPFEDDDDVHESNDDDEEGFDLDCSYANVQRTKQQLLYRLSRFEKLAELDPLELEQRMLDQENNQYGTYINEDSCGDGDSEMSHEEKELREIVYAIVNQSSRWRVPEDLKRLVYDLIMEEEIAEFDCPRDKEMVIERVCKRLELWKEVESNTIDMMIDEDFSREESGWKKNSQQVRDLAGELELAIFALLMEEFSEELVY